MNQATSHATTSHIYHPRVVFARRRSLLSCCHLHHLLVMGPFDHTTITRCRGQEESKVLRRASRPAGMDNVVGREMFISPVHRRSCDACNTIDRGELSLQHVRVNTVDVGNKKDHDEGVSPGCHVEDTALMKHSHLTRPAVDGQCRFPSHTLYGRATSALQQAHGGAGPTSSNNSAWAMKSGPESPHSIFVSPAKITRVDDGDSMKGGTVIGVRSVPSIHPVGNQEKLQTRA